VNDDFESYDFDIYEWGKPNPVYRAGLKGMKGYNATYVIMDEAHEVQFVDRHVITEQI